MRECPLHISYQTEESRLIAIRRRITVSSARGIHYSRRRLQSTGNYSANSQLERRPPLARAAVGGKQALALVFQKLMIRVRATGVTQIRLIDAQ